jgi:predicted O-methyltransferase YrrM
LKKSGERYINEPVASRYLVSGRPGYQGDILRHYSGLWDNWSGLDHVLKTGKPNRVSRDHVSFIMGMHNIASLKNKSLLPAIPLAGVKRVLDLGGGPGTYAMAFAAQGLDVTLMDYPETLKIARKVIGEAGLRGKVRLRPGDFTRDDMGSGYDLILVSQILHAYGAGECLSLLRRCRKALAAGGRVVVHEFLLNETKISPLPGAIFAVNMLVNTPAGRTYTAGEISSWLKKAGFHGITTKPVEDTVIISGRKKGRSTGSDSD